MKRCPRLVVASTAAAILGALAPPAFAQPQAAEPPWSNSLMPAGDWRTINRDLAATRYSPLEQIDTHNVATLEQAWTYQLSGNSTAVPIVVDGVMYVGSGNRVVALNAETGDEVWSYAVPAGEGGGPGGRGPNVSTRGVGYWQGDAETQPRILFMSGSRLIAVDASEGTASPGFGDEGIVDVGVPYGGTPTIYRDIAVIGAAVGEVPQGPPGNPRAFSARTGEKLWEFQTVPQPGQPFNETWGDGWENRSGTNMWAFAAPVDAARGIVYLPIAGPAPNYYGGGRPGQNVFGNSIVAVEADSGRYLWHFQTVHHDIWDADMPSGGALFDTIVDGRRVPTLAHVGKTSYLFVLNRETGEPVIEVEERPVPKGDVPGEWYSPTQPFPVKPGPLSRVSFTREDIVTAEDTSAAHAAACQEFWERSGGFYNAGPFTPFMYHEEGAPPQSTIQFPGGTGGVNWGGVAADPTTGHVYVNAHVTSLVGWVEDKDPNVTYSFEAVGSTQPYDRASILGVGPFFSFNAPLNGEWDENGRPAGPSLPCNKPPWAKLVAVDTNTGEIAWESVLGVDERLPEGKQLVGNAGSAGPTVTGGDLVFVGATNDRRFRAFDARTGEELWAAALESNANANPMSYEGRSGKQYVAIVAGDTVNVFTLP